MENIPTIYECPKCQSPITADTFYLHECFIPRPKKKPELFQILPIPVDEHVPQGYSIILAYAKGDEVVLPLNLLALENEEHHNCDWEGCTTLHHVVRFNIKHKYDIEKQLTDLERKR